MSYFQDAEGALHYLTDEDVSNGFERLLPAGCMPITDAQAEAIQNPPLTLAQAQGAQAEILSASCAAAIVSGFTSSALGTPYSYPSNNTPQHPDQSNLNASVTRALLAIRKAVQWAADVQVAAGTLIEDVNGDVCECVSAGPTGAMQPTWPTQCGQIVNDGGAQWQLWSTPFWCANAAGEWAWTDHSASQIMQVGDDAVSNVLAMQTRNASLQAQVSAATTVAEVQDITWS